MRKKFSSERFQQVKTITLTILKCFVKLRLIQRYSTAVFISCFAYIFDPKCLKRGREWKIDLSAYIIRVSTS